MGVPIGNVVAIAEPHRTTVGISDLYHREYGRACSTTTRCCANTTTDSAWIYTNLCGAGIEGLRPLAGDNVKLKFDSDYFILLLFQLVTGMQKERGTTFGFAWE
jgi:hypothetical protein